MIRDTLGEDAIIVASEEERGRGVRVTAAVEPLAFEIGDEGGVAGADSWLQYDDEQDIDAVAEELTDIMLRHCVPEDIIDNVVSCATVIGFGDVSSALVATLEHLFSYRALPITKYHKPIMMVGPPGSGKTLAVAKLAARGAMNGLNVGVITTDTVRAGGVEQLQAFTNLLQINLQKAHDPADLKRLCGELSQKKDQIIVDTAGLNPFKKDDVKILAKLIHAVESRPVLVLPAGIEADEAGEMARVFATMGVAEVLATRIDIARRMGALLAAAHQGGLSFSEVSNTPRVAQGLTPISPKSLAQMLMPRLITEDTRERAKARPLSSDARKTGTRQ